MKKIFILFLIPLVNFAFGHDIRMAIFEISENTTGLTIDISLDRADFLACLEKEFLSEFSEENMKELSWTYLRRKLKIEIDEIEIAYDNEELTMNRNIIHLSANLKFNNHSIKQVKLTNTCFVDIIEGHDNIMKLKLNDRLRSFRLNKKRTSTIASYE